MNEAKPTGLTPKALETRQRILDSALDLFREQGFEGTTMRGIATAARTSLGNVYYYFRSKEHLIQGFYQRSHDDHLAACRAELDRLSGLEERLHWVLRTKIESSEPYHRFAGVLFKTAADPRSPLSPFSPESAPVREQATELMSQVIVGSESRLSKELAEELPNLLWLYLMGVVLFWVHATSVGTTRTYRLIDATVPMVSTLIKASRLPILGSLAKRTSALMAELREAPSP